MKATILRFWSRIKSSPLIRGMAAGALLSFVAVPLVWLYMKWIELFFGGGQ